MTPEERERLDKLASGPYFPLCGILEHNARYDAGYRAAQSGEWFKGHTDDTVWMEGWREGKGREYR